MYKPDSADNVALRPATPPVGPTGYGHFRDADEGAGVQGTVVPANWLNMLIAELEGLRAMGVGDGIPDPGDDKFDDTQISTILDAVIDARIAATQPAPYPPGFILGYRREVPDLTVNGSTCQFFTGSCRATDDLVNIDATLPMMKDISAPWAPGDAAGGWPSGLAAPSTFSWVNAFVLANPSSGATDFGWDSALGGVNLLADAAASGFSKVRRIGIDEPMPGDVIRSFYQPATDLDWIEWAEPKSIADSVDVAPYAAAAGFFDAGVPPKTTARIGYTHRYGIQGAFSGSQPIYMRIWDADETVVEVPTSTRWNVRGSVLLTSSEFEAEQGPSGVYDVYVGSGAQFGVRYSPPAGITTLASFSGIGFRWDRGRGA